MVSDYHRILPLANLPIARFPIERHTEPLNFLVSDQRYQELLQKESVLTQFFSSRSWRLTAPLRWVNNFIARLAGRRG